LSEVYNVYFLYEKMRARYKWIIDKICHFMSVRLTIDPAKASLFFHIKWYVISLLCGWY